MLMRQMFLLTTLSLSAGAYAQDTDDTDDTEAVDTDDTDLALEIGEAPNKAADLAGEEGGPLCGTLPGSGSAGLGFLALLALASRRR